jgi:mannonate dehydratase
MKWIFLIAMLYISFVGVQAQTGSDEQLSYQYVELAPDFVKAVQQSSKVKMALHPDDPPIPVLQGIGHIFFNVDAIRKALSFSGSPSHGLTFC